MKISLTELVDIVAKAGVRKARQVGLTAERHEDEYSVAKDFYKPLRDAIVAVHKRGESKSRLLDLFAHVRDQKKIGRYRLLVSCYQKWWARNDLIWVDPVAGLYSRHGITVSINPEIGLRFQNGEVLIIKLYFKAEKLSRADADLITSLMATSLGRTDVAVLDVERRRIFLPPKDNSSRMMMLSAELAYIAELTQNLDKAA